MRNKLFFSGLMAIALFTIATAGAFAQSTGTAVDVLNTAKNAGATSSANVANNLWIVGETSKALGEATANAANGGSFSDTVNNYEFSNPALQGAQKAGQYLGDMAVDAYEKVKEWWED